MRVVKAAVNETVSQAKHRVWSVTKVQGNANFPYCKSKPGFLDFKPLKFHIPLEGGNVEEMEIFEYFGYFSDTFGSEHGWLRPRQQKWQWFSAWRTGPHKCVPNPRVRRINVILRRNKEIDSGFRP